MTNKQSGIKQASLHAKGYDRSSSARLSAGASAICILAASAALWSAILSLGF
ncbi:hypothetical protein [Iodidimonas nitroreducens]|uniref:hypothetical protein n=1 Tax=Iodidimonas nitroreducens TaxID=1236968 RepID=UPI0013784B16|nr:hypothetical protein [Iodidimonas nitroreducens]